MMAIAVSMVAKKTAMLRDVIEDTEKFADIAADQQVQKPKAPYSLGRTQLVFWSIIVIGSYLYLYINNNAPPQITNASIILLSISIGTTLVGKVIDDTQTTGFRHQDSPSNGFLIDILSDEKGISVHRLQNVIWSLIVAVIYIQTVFVSTANILPDESVITNQLLELMGISSGAYVGIKVTENMKSVPQQPNEKAALESNNEGEEEFTDYSMDAEEKPVG